MGRPRSTAIYEVGAVSVTGTEGRYRIRWSEKGLRRETTATTLAVAKARADEEAERLELSGGGSVSAGSAFGALAEAWVEAKGKRWSEGHAANQASLLRVHVAPALGRIACDRLTEADMQNLLDDMADRGYGVDHMSHLAKMLRNIGRYGVRRGVWSERLNPAYELIVPEAEHGLVDRGLVPTPAVVAELAANIARQAPNPDQALRREWMVRAAAGCGLRWGEVLALTPECIDGRRVSVQSSLSERTRQVKGPKTRRGRRMVAIPTEDLDLWESVVAATPDGPLALTERGAVWRNSNWHNQAFRAAAAATTGWPAGSAFHSLRHYAIYSWVDAGIHPGDVSKMAGHASSDFTYKRYIGGSTDYLEKALKLL